jgi:hypothetical protein
VIDGRRQRQPRKRVRRLAKRRSPHITAAGNTAMMIWRGEVRRDAPQQPLLWTTRDLLLLLLELEQLLLQQYWLEEVLIRHKMKLLHLQNKWEQVLKT